MYSTSNNFPLPPPYQYVRNIAPSALTTTTNDPSTLPKPLRPPPSYPPSASSGSRRFESKNINGVLSPPTREPPKSLQSRNFDADVTSLFNKHIQPLKRVFRYYSTRDDSGFDVIRFQAFFRCCTDFEVTPTFSSKKELRDSFDLSSGGGDSLEFPLFVECLGHVAVRALGKPIFAKLYPTPASRVNVLLGMWGFGNPATFDAILAKQRYARGE